MNAKLLLGAFCLFTCVIAWSFAGESPILEASIQMTPAYAPPGSSGNLQPGMPALVKALIRNSGGSPNAEGAVSIRFKLPKPLAAMGKEVIFETERAPLPAIKPGDSVEIAFTTPQQLPVIPEFLKSDWPMRLYETVVSIGKDEFVIGTGTITFSAHYYLGPGKAMPTVVPPGS